MSVSRLTRNMMAKFPSWMKLAKDPESIGAQFLDAFGLTLEDFKEELDEVLTNFYIDTAHLDIIDILHKVPLTTAVVSDTEDIDSVTLTYTTGERTLVNEAPTLRRFYQREAVLPLYYIDRQNDMLYLRLDLDSLEDIETPVSEVRINDAAHFNVGIHHVWNVFDEFGLLLGLNRLPKERNAAFKARILDVFDNPGNSTLAGIQSGVARELGLSRADVEVIPFHDRAFGSSLIKPDGTPTEKMVRYAKQINDTFKFTWDTLNLGEAYWFSIEQDNLGIDFLPHLWDVDDSLFNKDEFQSGIGHGDDLKVTLPKDEPHTRSFKAYVSLMGYVEQTEDFYPEIAFQYKVYAKGKVLEEVYEPEAFKYTLEAAEVFEQDYRLIASQDFPYTLRTEFYDKNTFEATPDRDKLNFGLSNDFLHTQTDSTVKLALNLATADEDVSNWVKNLEVTWEDTAGKDHVYAFKTQNDFLIERTNPSGNPETRLAFADVSYNAETGLGLGYGAFMKDIDTTVEWQQGSWLTDTVLIRNGEVTLNLDRMKRLMN